MIDVVILVAIGVLVGALIGYPLGHTSGTAQQARRTAPAPVALPGEQPPAPATQYEIMRNGRRVWYGSDPHDAKNWWEHQKRSPGRRSLVFRQDGQPRDHYEASE